MKIQELLLFHDAEDLEMFKMLEMFPYTTRWFSVVSASFFLLNSANYAIFAIFQLLNVFFSAVSTVATVREKTQANGIKSAKLKQTSRELSKCQFSLKF